MHRLDVTSVTLMIFHTLSRSYDEIRQMYDVGYDYAARLHAQGSFDNFDLAEVLLEVGVCWPVHQLSSQNRIICAC